MNLFVAFIVLLVAILAVFGIEPLWRLYVNQRKLKNTLYYLDGEQKPTIKEFLKTINMIAEDHDRMH